VVYLKQVAQRKKKRNTLLIICGAIILLGGSKMISQYGEIRTQQKEYERLQAQLEETKLENEELTLELQYMMTEDYILSVAREQLGLLKENEIRFVEDSTGN